MIATITVIAAIAEKKVQRLQLSSDRSENDR